MWPSMVTSFHGDFLAWVLILPNTGGNLVSLLGNCSQPLEEKDAQSVCPALIG